MSGLIRIRSVGVWVNRHNTTLTASEQSSAANGLPKQQVTGIGGFFFRAQDPKAPARWYQEHLGVIMVPRGKDDPVWKQQAGPTAFSPMSAATGYFGDSAKQWMLNCRVTDLDMIAAQLEAGGVRVKVDPQTYPNGRFARTHDPEGNPIELWQPLP